CHFRVGGWLLKQEVPRGAVVVRCPQESLSGTDAVSGSEGLLADFRHPLSGGLPRLMPAGLVALPDVAGGGENFAEAHLTIRGAHRWIIDKDHAGFDPARNLLAVLNIGGIDRATQPKGRVVCNSYGLVLIFGGKEERDWSKEFLPVDRIVGSDVGKNRWLHVRTRFTKPISSGE